MLLTAYYGEGTDISTFTQLAKVKETNAVLLRWNGQNVQTEERITVRVFRLRVRNGCSAQHAVKLK